MYGSKSPCTQRKKKMDTLFPGILYALPGSDSWIKAHLQGHTNARILIAQPLEATGFFAGLIEPADGFIAVPIAFFSGKLFALFA